MQTSIHLAQIIGLFGALSTTAIILQYKLYLSMEVLASKNPSTIYMSGFVLLLLGILVVVNHTIWSLDWRLIITLIGYMLLIKGLMRIFMTQTIIKMLEKKQSEKRFIYGEIAVFLLSVFLLYKGFFPEA